jgi:hypothetical protein
MNQTRAFPCQKAGCEAEATYSVTLDAADGSEHWSACRDHALAFRQWVINETERQGEHWASVEVEMYAF